MQFENILFKKTSQIAIIKLNRPDSYNAMNFGLLNDLAKPWKSVPTMKTPGPSS